MQCGFFPACSQTLFFLCSIRFLLHVSMVPSGKSLLYSLCFRNIKLILSHAHSMPIFGSIFWFRPFPLFGMLFPISSHKESRTSFQRQHDRYLPRETSLDPFPYTRLGAFPRSSYHTCDKACSWFIWHFQEVWHSGCSLSERFL